MTQHELDARGLLCPLPVIRTQNTIKSLSSGDLLKVTCTDPGAIHDIPAWCRIHGHSISHIEQSNKENIIIIQIK